LAQRRENADAGTLRARFLMAVAAGDIGAAATLLAAGAAIDSRTLQGKTALMVATQAGHAGAVRLLLNNGADVNQLAQDGGSVLQEAAVGGNAGIMQLLLARIAGLGHLNHRNGEGYTALIQAAYSGDCTIARLLLERGADVDWPSAVGETALMVAAREGKIDVASLLLAHGADRERADNLGSSPLIEAAYAGHARMVRLLLAAGANPNGSGPGNRDRPIYAAARRGVVEVAAALLDAPPARPDILAAALWMAASHGHAGMVMLLLERGAQPNLPQFLAVTALNEACTDLVLARLMPEPSQANPCALKDPELLSDMSELVLRLSWNLIDAGGEPSAVRPILHRALCAQGLLSLNVKNICVALGDVCGVWQMIVGRGRAVSLAQQTLCCASMLSFLRDMVPAHHSYAQCGLGEAGMRQLVPLAQRQADRLLVLCTERFREFEDWLKDLAAHCQRFTRANLSIDREGLQIRLTGHGGVHVELAGLIIDSWEQAMRETRGPARFAAILMDGLQSADYAQALRTNRAALADSIPYQSFLDAVHARVRQYCLRMLAAPGRRDQRDLRYD
jgi:ankyrin repeat protein